MSAVLPRYRSGGYFTSRSEWIHPDRRIDSYELIVVTEGSVSIMEEDARFVLTSGMMLLLQPGVRHFGFAPSLEKVSFYWLHFNLLQTEERLLPEKWVVLQDLYSVSLLCRQLLHYEKEQHESTVCDALLHVLLSEVKRQGSDRYLAPDSLVLRIREWIRINSDREMTISKVSAHFGYNEDYLSRLFYKYFGHGLKFEIDSMKLGEIKSLLLNTDLTLGEIAQKRGFSDYKLFLKFFKYHEGISPTEFRKHYRSVHTNNR